MFKKKYLDSRLKIFSLNSNLLLSKKIAKVIGIELGKLSVTRFSDGEIKINIEESIRGSHIYVVQSTSKPVNDNLMELLIMIDALKRASAKTINIVMPYYGYARQDRKARSREPITAKLIANMLEKAGITRILTLDLHASQIQGFFDIPVDHLMAVNLIGNYFFKKKIFGKNVVIVSPDHGGVKRARKLAEILKSNIAIIDKRRLKPNVVKIMNIIGNVKNKDCILIDDMIDTAGTILMAANILKKYGANNIYAACTHPVLSGNALFNIKKSIIKYIIVTDSIYMPNIIKNKKIVIVSISNLLGNAIKNIYENKSVSSLF